MSPPPPRAEPDGAAWRLTGLKCSPAMPAPGRWPPPGRAGATGRRLGCYLVPSTLPDGTPNRCKSAAEDKIGTRGLATGETMLDGTGLECTAAAWAEGDAEALEYSRCTTLQRRRAAAPRIPRIPRLDQPSPGRGTCCAPRR